MKGMGMLEVIWILEFMTVYIRKRGIIIKRRHKYSGNKKDIGKRTYQNNIEQRKKKQEGKMVRKSNTGENTKPKYVDRGIGEIDGGFEIRTKK